MDSRFADPAVQHSLREDTPTRRAVVDLAAGIPLLLQLLADLAAQAPGQPLAAPGGPIPEGRARIDYVVEHYVQRLAGEAYDDQENAARYRLLLYNAVPRRIPNDGLLGALLLDQPGTAYNADSDYRTLWNRLSHEAFVHRDPAGGLIYHEVIRAGFLAHLQGAERQRWRDLHRRAAAWWQAEPDEAEALYHAVQADYTAVIGELLIRIQAALDAQAWPLTQAIIGTTTELTLQPADGVDHPVQGGARLGRRQPPAGPAPPVPPPGPARSVPRPGSPSRGQPGSLVWFLPRCQNTKHRQP